MKTTPIADQRALQRVGEAVRARLAADPAAHPVAPGRIEMFAAGGFLSAAECARLRAMIDEVAQPSRLFEADAGLYRTSYSGDLDGADSFVRMVERRICDFVGIDPAWGESFQGQRYAPGQEFRAHYDWFDTAEAYWPGEEAHGGQRSWTVMIYLNDVEEGGATTFDRVGVTVEPQAGALLVWNNALADGSPNLDALHAAQPVVRGAKYVITKWFRTRPWG